LKRSVASFLMLFRNRRLEIP